MCVSTEELHLGQALLLHRKRIVTGVQEGDGAVDTGKAVVKAHPHVVDIPVGGQHTLLHFELMEHVTIAGATTTLVGIVGANIIVPHGEGGIDVLG